MIHQIYFFKESTFGLVDFLLYMLGFISFVSTLLIPFLILSLG